MNHVVCLSSKNVTIQFLFMMNSFSFKQAFKRNSCQCKHNTTFLLTNENENLINSSWQHKTQCLVQQADFLKTNLTMASLSFQLELQGISTLWQGHTSLFVLSCSQILLSQDQVIITFSLIHKVLVTKQFRN